MTAQFGRRIELTLGQLLFTNRPEGKASGLQYFHVPRISFNVERFDTAIPNNLMVSVTNLSPETRKYLSQLSQQSDLSVVIKAGYTEQFATIFSGQLNFVRHKFQAPNWNTTIEAGDASIRMKAARVNETIDPGTPIQNVLDALQGASNLAKGNMDEIKAQVAELGIDQITKGGKALVGNVLENLSDIFAGTGLTPNVQDGKLFITGVTSDGRMFLASTQTTIPLINEQSGMIGHPEPEERGIVQVKNLLRGDIIPGVRFQVESRTVNGIFFAKRVRAFGDTHGEAWYTEIESHPTPQRSR